MKYRVGRKVKRALLDETGRQVAIFDAGQEELAEKVAKLLNSSKVVIRLEDWNYDCSDGCCHDYGTCISLNNKECDNQYAGGEVEESLRFVLSELGIEHEIIEE